MSISKSLNAGATPRQLSLLKPTELPQAQPLAPSTPFTNRKSPVDGLRVIIDKSNNNNNNNDNNNNNNNNNSVITTPGTTAEVQKKGELICIVDEELINHRITRKRIPELLRLYSRQVFDRGGKVFDETGRAAKTIPATFVLNIVVSMIRLLNLIENPDKQRVSDYNHRASGGLSPSHKDKDKEVHHHYGALQAGSHNSHHHNQDMHFSQNVNNTASSPESPKTPQSPHSRRAKMGQLKRQPNLEFSKSGALDRLMKPLAKKLREEIMLYLIRLVSFIVSMRKLRDDVNSIRQNYIKGSEGSPRKSEEDTTKLVANIRVLYVVSEVKSTIIKNIIWTKRKNNHLMVIKRIKAYKIWRCWRRYRFVTIMESLKVYFRQIAFEKKCAAYFEQAEWRLKASARAVRESEEMTDAFLKYFINKEKAEKVESDPELDPERFALGNPVLKEMKINYFMPDTRDYLQPILNISKNCDYNPSDTGSNTINGNQKNGVHGDSKNGNKSDDNGKLQSGKRGTSPPKSKGDVTRISKPDKGKIKKEKGKGKNSKKDGGKAGEKIVISTEVLKRPIYDDPVVKSKYGAYMDDFVANSPTLSLFKATKNENSSSIGGKANVDWYKLASVEKFTSSESARAYAANPSNVEKVIDAWACIEERGLKSILDMRGAYNSRYSQDSSAILNYNPHAVVKLSQTVHRKNLTEQKRVEDHENNNNNNSVLTNAN